MEERPEGKGTWLDGVSVNQMGRKGSKGVGRVKDLPEGEVVLMKMFAKATELNMPSITDITLTCHPDIVITSFSPLVGFKTSVSFPSVSRTGKTNGLGRTIW